ncbi:MAG: transcription antitermination factor NusB [Lachnospiraceae bacterium]|nr:transcription antitermination factor NusB [Lachnospiraceae bacterium]
MTRSELREEIFRLLFRVEFNPPEDMEEQKMLLLEEDRELLSESDEAYISQKYEKIAAMLPEIDALLMEKADGWKKKRMGKVELAILRQAVYEIREDDTVPAGAAINEAVELAKKYGQENSGSFVNGVLAKFVKPQSKTAAK